MVPVNDICDSQLVLIITSESTVKSLANTQYQVIYSRLLEGTGWNNNQSKYLWAPHLAQKDKKKRGQ